MKKNKKNINFLIGFIFSCFTIFQLVAISTINNTQGQLARVIDTPKVIRGGGQICNFDPNEYICNGDFEMPINMNNYPIGWSGFGYGFFYCPSNFDPDFIVPHWCNLIGSPDIFDVGFPDIPDYYLNLPEICDLYFASCVVNTPYLDGERVARFFRSKDILYDKLGNEISSIDNAEIILTKLKSPLVVGESYTLSFDVLFLSHPTQGQNIVADFSITEPPIINQINQDFNLVTAGDQTISTQIISSASAPNDWSHIQHSFIATHPHEYLKIYSDFTLSVPDGHVNTNTFIDNISLKKSTISQEESQMVDIDVKKYLTDFTLNIFDRSIKWRIDVSNIGQNNATNIKILDLFPPDLVLIGYFVNQSGSFDPITQVFTIPSLAPGDSTSFELKFKVPRKLCDSRINNAILISLDQIDLNIQNNQSDSEILLKPCKINILNVKK